VIRAVLDTNVLASGFASHGEGSPPVQILDSWRTRFYTLIVSEHLLIELARTLDDRYFRRRLTPEEIAADLRLLHRHALMTDITVEVHGVATHQEDDLTLASALSAHADYLVTGDKKLREVGAYQGVRIVSPREFLELLLSEGWKECILVRR